MKEQEFLLSGLPHRLFLCWREHHESRWPTTVLAETHVDAVKTVVFFTMMHGVPPMTREEVQRLTWSTLDTTNWHEFNKADRIQIYTYMRSLGIKI